LQHSRALMESDVAFCIFSHILQTIAGQTRKKEIEDMKATGIVRRIDDLGRVVIPKEIRRTLRIRDGDPSLMTLARWQKFSFSMLDLAKRMGWE